MCPKMSWAGTRKKKVYQLCKKGWATQEDYKEIVRLYREKIRRLRAQLELNSTSTVNDKKNVSINTLTTKGWLRRISILY